MVYDVKTMLNITITCVSETEIISASLADWLGGWIADPIRSTCGFESQQKQRLLQIARAQF